MQTTIASSGVYHERLPRNIRYEGFTSEIQSNDPIGLKADTISQKIFKGNDDFGHLVHKEILGTFYPSTIEEIAQILSFANQENISISCKGKGHSTYGQAQVDQGIVIDLVYFCKVHDVVDNQVTVEAGALWKNVLKVTLKEGLTPPVLTDYLGLSVGGVLQLGGLGGQTHQHGLVADNIEKLKVITIDGQVRICSKLENTELFYASLTTLGQFSIILEATIKLDKAPETCQCSALYYTDFTSFFADHSHLAENKCCQYLEGQIVKYGLNPPMDSHLPAETNWYYMIEAVIYDERSTLNVGELHPISTQTDKKSYSDFIHRMKEGVKFLKSNKSWYQQNPWINVLLPHETAFKVVSELMESLTLEDTGGWPILLYPIDRSKLSCSNFKAPDSEMIWVLGILRNAQDALTAEKMIQKNRELYEKAVENGGVMYPHGSIPLTHADWKKHFGNNWKTFKALKKEHDPSSLLGLGQGIFKSSLG